MKIDVSNMEAEELEDLLDMFRQPLGISLEHFGDKVFCVLVSE